jgi:phosphohistidine phosphatase
VSGSAKRLTLMRHADTRWKDPGVSDLERPLTRRGSAAAETMARRLIDLQLVPELMLASPARRTQQTAEILAREFALPARRVVREEALYLASAADLLRVAQATGPRVHHLLIVAHNPGVSELMGLLVPDEADDGLAAGAVCSIGFEAPEWQGLCAASVREVRRDAPPSRLFGLFA